MNKYENLILGITFEYPAEWNCVYNCEVRYRVDVRMYHGLTNFGIVRVSDKIEK